ANQSRELIASEHVLRTSVQSANARGTRKGYRRLPVSLTSICGTAGRKECLYDWLFGRVGWLVSLGGDSLRDRSLHGRADRKFKRCIRAIDRARPSDFNTVAPHPSR